AGAVGAPPPDREVVSRLRLDAALWAPAPKRRQGQKGRPRRRGARLPTPQQVAARCRHWHTLTVTIYGRTVTTQVRSMHALWYGALRTQPVQIVLVRDPTGKRRDEAFFCTDPAADARFLLEAYARRWCLAVIHPHLLHPQVRRHLPIAPGPGQHLV